MASTNSILAVVSRSATDTMLLAKALRLARRFGTGLELFLCDSEHAYVLQHAYERNSVEGVRAACVADAMQYLARARESMRCDDVPVAIDASCETPLYEGVVRKARRSHPLLVIKHAGGLDRQHRATFDPNDWQLMRACPTTLMLTRGRMWRPTSRLAAAVDVSEQEMTGLARQIVENAKALARAGDAQLELLYAERNGAGVPAGQVRTLALESLARESRIDSGQVHVLAGEPEVALPRFATERGYDAIVLGALTHKQGPAPLVGTLTSSLVDALDCDFVLVKPNAANLPDPLGPQMRGAT